MRTYVSRWSLPILLLAAVAGCGPDTYLHNAEKQLGVERSWYYSDLRVWHTALFQPHGEGLRSPGYIVGIEDIHPSANIPDQVNDVPLPKKSGFYITHIVRYDPTSASAESPRRGSSCVLFSMIDRDGHAVGDSSPNQNSTKYVFDPCPKPAPGALTGRGKAIEEPRDFNSVALAPLHADLPALLDAQHATDLIVMVMGWNTEQEAALNNFSALAGHMMDEAKRQKIPFRPVIVGVSWPSEWQLDDWSVIPDPVVRGVSFPFKAMDADEIGLNIISAVLRNALAVREASASHFRVDLIGHSFGARALVNAVKAIDPQLMAQFDKKDRMILLEGAFEFYRLFTDAEDKFDDADGHLDGHFAKGEPRVTLTASHYDTAVSAAFWGRYAGDARTYDDVCRNNPQVWKPPFRHQLTVDQIGCAFPGSEPNPSDFGIKNCSASPSDYVRAKPYRFIDAVKPPAGGSEAVASWPVRYVDASYMINCNEPMTGGGAHSDIFRDETARFLIGEITR